MEGQNNSALIDGGAEIGAWATAPLADFEPERLEWIASAVPGGMENIQDVYPLAPLQEGILFHHVANESQDAYIISTLLVCESREKLDALIAAIGEVVSRHDILRTAVLWEGLQQPLQVVCRRASMPVETIQLDPGRAPIEQLNERMRINQPRLDLRRAPIAALQVATDPKGGRCYALLHIHHIVCDGKSHEVVLSEVIARMTARDERLPDPVPYKEYVVQALARTRTREAEAFFQKKLAAVDESTAPFGLLDVYGEGRCIDENRLLLDSSLTQRIRTLARRYRASAATVFHAAWGLVVASTSGKGDVVFGTVILGRSRMTPEGRTSVGMFINTLPLRLRVRQVTAKELVQQTQQELFQLLIHDQAPLALARRCSGVAAAAPLFSTLLDYRDRIAGPEVERAGIESGISVVGSRSGSNYPISLSVEGLSDGFVLTAHTDARVKAARVTAYMHAAVCSLVEALETAPETSAAALSVLPPDERKQVLELFNATRVPYRRDRLVHQLFEEQALRSPGNAAVVYEGLSLSYGELDAQANQLARYLREQGVGPNQLVGIWVERGLEMVVGVLGVLKAGAAYVPLDPKYPPERLAYMLEDAAPRILLIQERLRGGLPKNTSKVISLDAEWMEIGRRSNERLVGAEAPILTPSDLAYVIYTSGSTGEPKGVMVSHGNLTASTFARSHFYGTPGRFLLVSSVAFDSSVAGIFGTLTGGGTLLIAPYEALLDPQRLRETISRLEATALLCVPWLYQNLLAIPGASLELTKLSTVIVAGEACPPALVLESARRLPQVTVFNEYGPTEGTVWATVFRCDASEPLATVPIGQPVANVSVYILDEDLRPVPVGVAGELYIGGEGVAQGYLHRPELTESRFVRDPFSTAAEARLYKTGDLGRWRADGNIEYLGRNDQQVKIRGFRVELGEVEACLAQSPQIAEAVVVLREDSPAQKLLVAYVVPRADRGKLNLEVLREHLRSSLPEYMVPGAVVVLSRLPLTANGKLNRRDLPAPQADAYASRRYEPPRGEIEEALAQIWQGLLGVERVGREDNFFELGGHSLLVVQMLGRLRSAGLSVQVRQVFDSPTLADLANSLTRTRAETDVDVPPNGIPPGCEAITPAMLPLVSLETEHLGLIERSVAGGARNIEDIYPLSPLQEGILFHHLLNEREGDTYVLPTLFEMRSRATLDRFVEALQWVVKRYDTLRSSVFWEQLPRPVQVVHRQAQLPVDELILASDPDPIEQLKERMRPERQRLDLDRAPLMRLLVAEHPPSGRCFALLQLHHLVCGGYSQEILIQEAIAFLEGRADELPEPVPYRNYLAQVLADSRAEEAERFFRTKLGDLDEPTAPFGLLDVHADGSRIEEAHELLDVSLDRRLRLQARRFGVGAATIFHAAWALVVARTSRREDVVFGTVLSGHLQESMDTQRMLGMFLNTLPLRLCLKGFTARELLEHARHGLSELLEHNQTSLAVAQRCSGLGGTAPLFTALLNYRHYIPDPEEERVKARSGIRAVVSQYWTNYPITLSVDDSDRELALTVQTDRRIDPYRLAAYMRTALHSLVEALESAPETPATELRVLPESERAHLIRQLNATEAPLSSKLVHELFEEQVQRTPAAVAVRLGERSLTYEELDRKASHVALYLAQRGVRADDVVGICMERRVEMVVGVVGILKAGAAYLPLDPNYPRERLQYMVEDACPPFVLTSEALTAVLPAGKCELVVLDAVLQEPPVCADARACRADVVVGPTQESLVYVIYTSGSTGRPKGTAMIHRAMVNLIEWHRRTFETAVGCRVLQFAALSFDVAFQEIFSTLCTGGTLMLLDEWVRRDARALSELLSAQAIERLFLPPLVLQALAEYSSGAGTIPGSLRDVITAGEQLRVSPEVVSWFERLPGCRLHNHYGPTETHVVTALTLEGEPRTWPAFPAIGWPISNVRIYVLDERLRPVPMGVAGEIFIGGAGVARGYLRRPELTVQRFINDPFSSVARAPHEQSQRLYRTGDLGRWTAEGVLEYLGRNDQQVKLRGYRIEPGEIEAQLALHPQIREAAVVLSEDAVGQKRLVAYVTPRGSELKAPSPESLRAHLSDRLPEYMIPGAFVALKNLPLTPSGKLDRRALPAPELDAYASRQYEAPRGEMEEMLAGIWSDLLKVPRVGRRDNFFELGGHSLLIVQLMARIRRSGLSVEVRRVFESATLADLAELLSREGERDPDVPPNGIPAHCDSITPSMLTLVQLTAEQIDHIVQVIPGGARNIQDIYPLAPLQEGILFHHLLDEKAGDTYARSILLAVPSREKLDQLAQALQLVITRHDVLRTAVVWEQLPQPLQVVCRKAELPVSEVALQADRDPIEQMKERLNPQARLVDLRRAPLVRLEIAADPLGVGWYAILHTHHFVCDNQSLDILMSELAASLNGLTQKLPEPVAYRTHVAQSIALAERDKAEAFFRDKLGDVDEPTAPFGITDVQGDGNQIECALLTLDGDLESSLRAQARRLCVSAATLFHAAWGLVLARTTGRYDVVFGSVLLGRLQGSAGAQRILGMFINTLPLRLKLHASIARELVEQTQRGLIELLSHEQASLAVAQRCSGIAESTPLFTSLLNYRHAPSCSERASFDETGLRVIGSQGGTNYPIVLSVDDLGERFALRMETDRRIDPQRLLGYVRTALESLVRALISGSAAPVSTLSVLPAPEWHQVIEGFNATQRAYPLCETVHELFEAQVRRTPQAEAVTFEDQSLSYAELNGRANQLAHYLRGLGVGAEDRVGICLERSVEMVTGLLGILKSGAAFVPLDPTYPADRLAYMLADSAPKVLLIQERLRHKVSGSEVAAVEAQVVTLDSEWSRIAMESRDNLPVSDLGRPRGNQLAYVIYTSGSTGRPKGAMNEHRGVVNRLRWMQDAYQLSPDDCVLQKTPFSFDVSVWEFFWTLSNGAHLVVARPEGHKDPLYLRRLIEEKAVTRVHFVPSMLQIFLDPLRAGQCASLRQVVCSGEELPASLQAKCFACLPQVRLSNLYGPTEAAVDVTSWECRPDDRNARVPIGYPIANIRMYVLDAYRQPVPIGVPGEIYIAGVGVGRGYLNRPDLTAERFVSDPFGMQASGADTQARMYRTGDLGRWRPDGAIEYLGRNDHQVKIRGFRIELGEIEARLLLYPHVREAVVVAREDVPGEKRLVAYLVASDPESALDIEQLRARLAMELPDYMVPAAFVTLARMPLTPNGKLDRSALPVPDGELLFNRSEYEAPRGEIEDALAGIWAHLLRLERVGRNDNFFRLGGHSLLGVKVIVRVMELFGIQPPVTAIFRYPTIRELARFLESAGVRNVDANLNPRQTGELIPLAFSQRWHWDLLRLRVSPSWRTTASATVLEGDLDEDALQSALDEVVARHEALRTRIVVIDGVPRQEVVSRCRVELDKEDLGRVSDDRRAAMLRRMMDEYQLAPVDLSVGPLFGMKLLCTGPAERVLLIAMHHLISDARSLNVLLSDLLLAYQNRLGGGQVVLPPPAIQFPDYAVWQAKQQSAWVRKHAHYWRERLEAGQRLRFPIEEGAGGVGIGSVPVRIGGALRGALREWSQRRSTTLVMTVLTAYARALMWWSGESDAFIQYQTNGRVSGKVDNTIGYFASLVCLHVRCSIDCDVVELLHRVTEAYCAACEHGDYSYMAMQMERGEFARNTLFNWIPHPASPAGVGGLSCRALPLEAPGLDRIELDNDPELILVEGEEEITGQVSFPRSRFSQGAMEAFARTFLRSLEEMVGPGGG